jgi:hypothetical protein
MVAVAVEMFRYLWGKFFKIWSQKDKEGEGTEGY